MSCEKLVVCVKIHPGTNWQDLYVNGQRVATVWGEVTEITREVHPARLDTYCVTIGKPSDPVAFYHVDAYTYGNLKPPEDKRESPEQKEVSVECQSAKTPQ
jgi:hypothetical protein